MEDTFAARVSIEDVQSVTDAVRKAATDALDPSRFVVMTRKNMDVIVAPEDRKCLSGMCYAEIGRRLQARFVVGGNVRDFGELFGVTIEAYESKTGTVMGVEQGEARDRHSLLALVRELAPRLLRRVLGMPAVVPPPRSLGGSGPSRVAHLGEARAEVGLLQLEGSPNGARIDISGLREFGVRGKVVTTLPYGPVEVPAGEYRIVVSSPGYDSESRTVFIPAE